MFIDIDYRLHGGRPWLFPRLPAENGRCCAERCRGLLKKVSPEKVVGEAGLERPGMCDFWTLIKEVFIGVNGELKGVDT